MKQDTARAAQVAKIEKLEKMLSTCRKNQVKLIKDLNRKINVAKRDLAAYDRYQLEAEASKLIKENKVCA